jgi:hypothetical protein
MRCVEENEALGHEGVNALGTDVEIIEDGLGALESIRRINKYVKLRSFSRRMIWRRRENVDLNEKCLCGEVR